MYRQRLLHQSVELGHLLVDEELGVGLGLLELEHVAEGQLGDLQAAPCLLGIDACAVIGRLGGEAFDPGNLALGLQLLGMLQMVGQPLLDLLLGLHHLGRQHHPEVGLGELSKVDCCLSTSNCCASLTWAWRMSCAASMRPPVNSGHSILTELVTTFCLVRG